MSDRDTFKFKVDLAHNRAHDEYYRNPKQLQLSAVLIGVLLILVGWVVMWQLDYKPGGIEAFIAFCIVGIVFFAVAAAIPKRVGTPQTIYDNYPLAPAIITSINPDETITLLALVDAATQPDPEHPLRALASREVKTLPGHHLAVGEQVPVVAVPGRRAAIKNRDRWVTMTLMPVAWATKEQTIIATAIQRIPVAQWRKLKREASHVDAVTSSKTNLIPLSDLA